MLTIASTLPLFEQGMVEKNGNVAAWMVLESNMPNEHGRRMHFYQCIVQDGKSTHKKSGYCSKPATARQSAIKQARKLLDEVHPSEFLPDR